MKNLHGKFMTYVILATLCTFVVLLGLYWAPTVFRVAMQSAAVAATQAHETLSNLLGN